MKNRDVYEFSVVLLGIVDLALYLVLLRYSLKINGNSLLSKCFSLHQKPILQEHICIYVSIYTTPLESFQERYKSKIQKLEH